MVNDTKPMREPPSSATRVTWFGLRKLLSWISRHAEVWGWEDGECSVQRENHSFESLWMSAGVDWRIVIKIRHRKPRWLAPW